MKNKQGGDQHTQWKATKTNIQNGVYATRIEAKEDGEYLALAFGENEEESKERAKLIASAPQLLAENKKLKEILKNLTDFIDKNYNHRASKEMQEAKAAIKLDEK